MRVVPGETWKHHPPTIEGLRRLGSGVGRFSPRAIVDSIQLEVDGVDITRGEAEGPLLDVLSQLLDGARAVAAPGARTRTVALGGSKARFLLEGRNGDTAVSFVAGDAVPAPVVVPSTHLIAAIRRGLERFVADLEACAPALADSRVLVAIRRSLTTPPRRSEEPPEPRFGASAPLGRARLALRLDRPGVAVLAEDGRVTWSAAGSPTRLLADLRTRSRGEGSSRIAFGRTVDVSPAVLARAVATLTGEIVEDGADDLDHLGAIPELPAGPVRKRRRLPSGAAGLRKLRFQRHFKFDAGSPVRTLQALRGAVVFTTDAGAGARSLDGAPIWQRAGADATVLESVRRPLVLLRDPLHRLVLVAARSGELVVRGKEPVRHGWSRAVVLDPERVVLASESGFGVASLRDGSLEWWRDETSPRIEAVAGGICVCTPTSDQLFTPEGTRIWRRAASGVVRAVGTGASLVWVAREGGVTCRERTSGTQRWKVPFAEEPCSVLGDGERLYVGSRCQLLCLDAASGVQRWAAGVAGEGEVTPVLVGAKLLVPRTQGGLVVLARSGRVVAERLPREVGHEYASSRVSVPAVGEGLIAVGGAAIHLFETREARPVATVETRHIAPTALVLAKGPTLVAADADGVIEALRAVGHLRIV